MEFSGNSNVSKAKKKAKEKTVEQVVSNVKVSKESEVRKLRRQFLSEDAGSVKEHVVTSVIIPGIQRLFTDIVKNGVDWIVYGIRGGGSSQGGGPRNISYGNYYDKGYSYVQPRRQGMTPIQDAPGINRPTLYSIDQVTFYERGDAEVVLAKMDELIHQYGTASVSDFYDLVGTRGNYTDVKWGWRDLSRASVVRGSGGYIINFPTVTGIE